MSFEARVLTVLIASPGDTAVARDVVESAVLGWNRDRARGQRVVLLPLRWEVDAVPQMGGDAQSVINAQLVDEADIVVGLFHSRLGRPTARGPSGTAEELERSADRGAAVHVWFSEMPLPSDVDIAQLEALRQFRPQLEERGLVGTYASPEDLSAKVRTALECDVAQLVPAAGQSGEEAPRRQGAVLRARYQYDREPDMDRKGRTRMRTRRERLTVENLGDAAAETLTVLVEPVGEGEPPQLPGDATAERLPGRAYVDFPLITYDQVAQQWRVTMSWTEDGEPRSETQTVNGH